MKSEKTKCQLCSSEFTNRGIARHIKTCLAKQLAKSPAKGAKKSLYVKVSCGPSYFLHLLLREDVTFGEFDSFLRNIWLECCGHMSAFSFERYGDEVAMSLKVKQVLAPGMSLIHQYDFGSTTELLIEVLEVCDHMLKGKDKIQILARNSAPFIPCDECGEKPAVQICTECQWEGGGWLCEDCAATHECDEDMFLPVVNSPRTGVCGYCG